MLRRRPARRATLRPVDDLLLLGVVALVFALWLLSRERTQWFVTDEFDYFTLGEDGRLLSWLFRPHNEHTIVFTKAWYQLLFSTIGLRHYVVYALPLVAAHVIVALTAYRFVWIATASRVMAFGTACVVLAMGAGAGTLFWAGQFQYAGCVAAGLVLMLVAVEGTSRAWTFAATVALTLFGTFNGSIFLAFGLAAAVVFLRRRLWTRAVVSGGVPVLWAILERVIWQPDAQYAANGPSQVLAEGPQFAYAVLATAVRDTVKVPELAAPIILALVLGTLGLLSRSPKASTELTVRASGALALTCVLTMLLLVAGRLGRGAEASSGGGYSYLFLSCLLPLTGVLLGTLTSGRRWGVWGAGALLVVLAMAGLATLNTHARSFSDWKLSGARQLQTAAAVLPALDTFPGEVPVPSTAPTVDQREVLELAERGALDPRNAGSADVAQVSLNVQWRATSDGQAATCQLVDAGASAEVAPFGAVIVSSLTGSTAAEVDLRYRDTEAVRSFSVSDVPRRLESLAQQPATLTAGAVPVRVCS